MMADVEEVEVVVAHHERATLRVGDVFLKIDADQTRTDVEVEAMAMAPIPTPEVLWRKPPVLALAALPGTALGRLGEPSTASSAAWAAAGAAARMLHDAPLPPWPGRSPGEIASELDGECAWLVTNGVLPAGLVTRNRRVAEAALALSRIYRRRTRAAGGPHESSLIFLVFRAARGRAIMTGALLGTVLGGPEGLRPLGWVAAPLWVVGAA